MNRPGNNAANSRVDGWYTGFLVRKRPNGIEVVASGIKSTKLLERALLSARAACRDAEAADILASHDFRYRLRGSESAMRGPYTRGGLRFAAEQPEALLHLLYRATIQELRALGYEAEGV